MASSAMTAEKIQRLRGEADVSEDVYLTPLQEVQSRWDSVAGVTVGKLQQKAAQGDVVEPEDSAREGRQGDEVMAPPRAVGVRSPPARARIKRKGPRATLGLVGVSVLPRPGSEPEEDEPEEQQLQLRKKRRVEEVPAGSSETFNHFCKRETPVAKSQRRSSPSQEPERANWPLDERTIS